MVDASAAVKWVIDEDGSDRARELQQVGELIAPSLILAEVGSALWKSARRGALHHAQAAEGLALIARAFGQLVAIETLHARALGLALELRHPIYDCFYIALAERESAMLVSADAKLLEAAGRAKIKSRPL